MGLNVIKTSRCIFAGYWPAICVVLLLTSCSGADSSNDVSSDEEIAASAVTDSLFLHPAAFDIQSIDDTYRIVRSDNVLGDEDLARAVIVAQSGVDRLGQMIEALVADNDMADTYGVLQDLKQTHWPLTLRLIIENLDNRPLTPATRLRVEALVSGLYRIEQQLENLRRQNEALPDIFSI